MYRLGLPSAPLHYGITWPVWILTALQTPVTVPLPRGGGGGGGYSLCDGWYICAAVLTPFFHFGRIEHDLFGAFFSSTNSKAIFWGTKTTNFYKNRSFWPQIQFFPRSFWVQLSAASGTPPSVFRPSTPPRANTALTADKCLPFGLCKGTVKESISNKGSQVLQNTDTPMHTVELNTCSQIFHERWGWTTTIRPEAIT